MTLAAYQAMSGRLVPVYRIEIQTRPGDADRLLDAIVQVHPLDYGHYHRNASVSAVGAETAQPRENTTTAAHLDGFSAGGTETYPMIELKLSIEPDAPALARIMDAVTEAHHYEQPVIYVREEWASRANYNPHSTNPNRWWNDGRGLPERATLEKTGLYPRPQPFNPCGAAEHSATGRARKTPQTLREAGDSSRSWHCSSAIRST